MWSMKMHGSGFDPSLKTCTRIFSWFYNLGFCESCHRQATP
jgi:hypothetical protein